MNGLLLTHYPHNECECNDSQDDRDRNSECGDRSLACYLTRLTVYDKIVDLTVELETGHPDRSQKILESYLVISRRKIDRTYAVSMVCASELRSQMALKCRLDITLSLLPTVIKSQCISFGCKA